MLFRSVKNIGGTVTVSSLVGAISILDGALTATVVDTSVSGANVLLRVTGIALTTINWIGRVQVLAQDF